VLSKQLQTETRSGHATAGCFNDIHPTSVLF